VPNPSSPNPHHLTPQQQQQQQPPLLNNPYAPNQAGPRGNQPPPYPPPAYYNQHYAAAAQQQQQQPNPYGATGRVPWQPVPNQGYPSTMRGGVFYPPPAAAAGPGRPSATNAGTIPASVVVPRERKALVIMDKDGNVMDFTKTAPKKTTTTTSATLAPSAVPAKTESSSQDAGAKLRQAALERIQAQDKAKKEAEEKAKEQLLQEEQAKKKASDETEVQGKNTSEAQSKVAEEPTKSLADRLKQAPKPATVKTTTSSSGRIVFSKSALLKFKSTERCMQCPESLPDMTIVKGPARGKSGGNRGGGGGGDRRNDHDSGGSSWKRGNAPPRRQSATNNDGGGGGGGGGSYWSRGQAPPPQQQQQNNDKHRNNRGGRGPPPPLYDGPVAPLVKSENHWRPQKNASAFIIAEKQVKAILNKMTKEKFDKLATQMLEIPLTSSDMLKMMINNVYDKAIDEPTFGDMYADLCKRLSKIAIDFIKIIESDEEPPTDDDTTTEPASPADDKSSHHTVYRWSNDVSTTDSEIVGPFESEEECIEVALGQANEPTPVERGEMSLELVSATIRKGVFIKIMKQKKDKDGEEPKLYTVYFPVKEAKECGQQLSNIFLSKMECVSDATKLNSFKRSLLNKCEEEFDKQDIYVDWKKEKNDYEAKKATLTAQERAETEAELDFRRIRIKKQMLGNVKFIGQLYKKGLLKEKIMRYCIASLLKLEANDAKAKNPLYRDTGDFDIDEEDHEAICSMFTTIGLTIDTLSTSDFMSVCFEKISKLSNESSLPARSRFMYKDLLELRDNRWVPRRKEEKAKTLEEIRKDVEEEERRQAQQSMRNNSNRGGGGGSRDFRGSGIGNAFGGSNRSRPQKLSSETDADGFVAVPTKTGFASLRGPAGKPRHQPSESTSTVSTKSSAFSALAKDRDPPSSKKSPAPLDSDTLERRIKRIRTDFMGDGGNVEELLLSWDEICGTPKAGVTLVQKNSDRMMDCKEDERQAIVRIVAILAEKGKLTKEDVRTGLQDAIEFIDSFILDSPRAYEYLGDMLGEMLKLKAIDVAWLCKETEKTKVDQNSEAPIRLTRATISALKAAAGVDFAKKCFSGSSEKDLIGLIGSDSWKSMAADQFS
jgi:translation initiation factor 4G